MSEEGTPQGGSISPLLANIYLHYVFDLWTKQWRSRYVQGDVIAVRYADDTVVGFQYKQEADRYLTELTERMAKFGLTLNQSKTSLFEFGRYATERCKKRGFRKPKTFEFLGLTHACRKTREDKFTVRRLTIKKRMREKLQLIKTELRRRMHHKIAEVGKWLRSVLRGHYRYYGVSGNFKAMEQFRYQILMLWRSTLRRRSQQRTLTWESMSKIATAWLPKPEVYHISSASENWCHYLRQEPYAGKPPVRICAGGARQLAFLSRPIHYSPAPPSPSVDGFTESSSSQNRCPMTCRSQGD